MEKNRHDYQLASNNLNKFINESSLKFDQEAIEFVQISRVPNDFSLLRSIDLSFSCIMLGGHTAQWTFQQKQQKNQKTFFKKWKIILFFLSNKLKKKKKLFYQSYLQDFQAFIGSLNKKEFSSYENDKKHDLIKDIIKKIAEIRLTNSEFLFQSLSDSLQEYNIKIQNLFHICKKNEDLELFDQEPQILTTMSGLFPLQAKGFAIHPNILGEYIILDSFGLLKCIESITNTKNVVIKFEKQFKKDIEFDVVGTEDSVDYSPSGKNFLVTIYQKKSVYIYSSQNGELKRKVKGFKEVTIGRWFGESNLLIADWNGGITYIDIENINKKKAILNLSGFILIIISDYNQKNLYIGDSRGNIYKYNFDLEDYIWKLNNLHEAEICCITKAKDYIASGSADSRFIIVKDSTKQVIYRSQIFSDSVFSLSLSPNGQYMYGQTAEEAFFFNVDSKIIKKEFDLHHFLNSSTVDWKNSCILSSDFDGTVFKINFYYQESNSGNLIRYTLYIQEYQLRTQYLQHEFYDVVKEKEEFFQRDGLKTIYQINFVSTYLAVASLHKLGQKNKIKTNWHMLGHAILKLS